MIRTYATGAIDLRLPSTSWKLATAAALGLWLPVANAHADWQQDLAADIDFEHSCEVAFLSHVVEREVEGKLMVMAKVHCTDQRTFDAVRTGRLEPFEFKECTVREKQSC